MEVYVTLQIAEFAAGFKDTSQRHHKTFMCLAIKYDFVLRVNNARRHLRCPPLPNDLHATHGLSSLLPLSVGVTWPLTRLPPIRLPHLSLHPGINKA